MPKIESKQIFIFACFTWIAGLMWSRFGISLGMIFMLLAGLWGGNFQEKVKAFFSNKYYLAVFGIFIIFLVSGIYSENTEYFAQRMRIKLPFLFLPFAFCASKGVDKKSMRLIFLFFIIVTLSGVLWSLSHFLLDVETYVENYSKGQIIPTPIHHIRYSIMIAVAISMSGYLLMDKSRLKEKYFLIGSIVFLTIYLHILAVRSGLLALYVLVLFSCIYYFLSKRNFKLLLGIVLFSILAITFSVSFVPTVKKKIGYTLYSLQLFKENKNIRELSDSRRLGSIAAGIQLGKEHPLVGVGYGDLMDETDKYLEKHYPELVQLELLPHNQYVLAFAALGLIGLILFTAFTLLPLAYLEGYKDFFFMSSQLMLFSSFLVEHTIESQIGTALFIFVLLIGMKNMEAKSVSHNA